MRAALVLTALLLFGPGALAQSAPSFPALGGRVVDAAGILQPEARAGLDAKLKAHENKTSDQVVVATVPSLGDLTVEDYANRLYRQWQLGEKTKNNGVLLLVAPNQRKLRIEVGYGLEGALTDALSKVIISTTIAPRFKQGDYAGGLDAGVDAILAILTGDAEEWQRRAKVRSDEGLDADTIVALFVFLLILILVVRMMRGGGGPDRLHRSRSGSWIPLPVPSGGSWGGGSLGGASWGGGGGFSGGGFSGGGGSSGGGGASGGW